MFEFFLCFWKSYFFSYIGIINIFLKINVLLIICVLAYLYQKINYCLLLTPVIAFVTIFIYYTNHEMQMKDSTYIQVLQKD